jgi:hypothetical protein
MTRLRQRPSQHVNNPRNLQLCGLCGGLVVSRLIRSLSRFVARRLPACMAGRTPVDAVGMMFEDRSALLSLAAVRAVRAMTPTAGARPAALPGTGP